MRQSRREFLAVTGTVAAGSALTACESSASESSPQQKPISFDRTTEVLVTGTGFAGLSAAIAAFDAGAKVLVLEKTDRAHEGGNSRVSGQGVMVPDPTYGPTFFATMSAGHMSFFNKHPELVTAWVAELNRNVEWIQRIVGVTLGPLPNGLFAPEEIWLDPNKTTKAWGVQASDGSVQSFGAVLWNPMKLAFASRNIEVLYQTPATKLLTDSNGNVIGAVANNNGQQIAIKATKGIVLATGGYEFDNILKENFLHAPIYGAGSPYNTGDGIKMAMQLGCDLWHMNNAQGPIWLAFLNGYTDASGQQKYLDPSISADVPFIISCKGKSFIWVDQAGNRFMNEGKSAMHGRGYDEFNFYDGSGSFYTGNPTPVQASAYPRNPAWIVFDEAARTAGALGHPPGALGLPAGWSYFSDFSAYAWSEDNLQEVANGAIFKGTDWTALEQAMGVPPGNLQATVAKWNADMSANSPVDTLFGRPATKTSAGATATVATPFSNTGPYYAIRLFPVAVNTQGGPRRNEKAQVVRPDDTSIPHLYSAGECGSIYTWQYNGGGNIAEAIAYGRLAGENAATDPPV